MQLSFVKQNVLQRRANFKYDEKLLRKSKTLLENVNNKSPSAVRSGRESCRVNMTVLLSFEEKKDDAHACAQSRHCPFNT